MQVPHSMKLKFVADFLANLRNKLPKRLRLNGDRHAITPILTLREIKTV